jgi:hypothetical protein
LLLVPQGVQIVGGTVESLIKKEKQRKMSLVARLTGRPLPNIKQDDDQSEPIDEIEVELVQRTSPSHFPVLDIENGAEIDLEEVKQEPKKKLRILKTKK